MAQVNPPGMRNSEGTPIYDTYELAANTAVPTQIVMFSTPISSTKTKAYTNLTRPYQIGAGDLFHMRALRIVMIGMDDSDIVNLWKKYCVSFSIDNATPLEAPPEYWPGGAGIAGVSTATSVKQLSNGVADPRAITTFEPANTIEIDGSSIFKVELNGTSFTSLTGGPGLFWRVYLDGVWEKA